MAPELGSITHCVDRGFVEGGIVYFVRNSALMDMEALSESFCLEGAAARDVGVKRVRWIRMLAKQRSEMRWAFGVLVACA